MRLKIKTMSTTQMGVILIILLISFLSPLQEVLSRNFIICLYLLGLFLILIGSISGGVFRFSKKSAGQLVLLFLLLIIYLYNNAYLKYGDMQYFMIGFTSVCLMILLSVQKGWEMTAVKTVLFTSMIHMAATFIFFFVPSLWEKYSEPIFGGIITGTRGGEMGYTAGLNGHYSTNGTLLVFGSLCIIALLLVSSRTKRKNVTILFIISVISVLLSQKRAHILFLAICFVITYFLFNWKKDSLKTMLKLSVIVLFAFLAVVFIIQYIPALDAVFERYTTIGQDAESLTRLTMWEYAYDIFSSHKIFGVGWGSYRYYVISLNLNEGSVNAHNIYLQLLAETGIIGFCVFMMIAVTSYVGTLKLLINCNKPSISRNSKIIIIFSAVFQTFLLLYGFTGNPIYDFCFVYYAVSVAVGRAVWNREGKLKL